MNRARSEELQPVTERAFKWIRQPDEGAREVMDWLMQSPLHIREALIAMVWDEEIHEFLGADRQPDVWLRFARAVTRKLMRWRSARRRCTPC